MDNGFACWGNGFHPDCVRPAKPTQGCARADGNVAAAPLRQGSLRRLARTHAGGP
jgi:hypothetical protein